MKHGRDGLMGYYSHIWGAIEFAPPATWAEIRAAGDNLVKLEVISEEVETPEGVLTKRTSRRIVVAYDGDVKAYGIKDALQQVVDALPGREFAGEFRVEGEDNADISRLFVDARGKVVQWRATLLWPDGGKEEPS